MLPQDIEETLLFRCVSESQWSALSGEKFWPKYAEEVSNLNDLVCEWHVATLPTYGACVVYGLTNGYVILESLGKSQVKFSLFESAARADSRDHTKRWNDFARGHWTVKVPQEPGKYFVCDREFGAQSIRELVRVNGVLRDTQGFTRPGKVSEYMGYWYLPALPALRLPRPRKRGAL